MMIRLFSIFAVCGLGFAVFAQTQPSPEASAFAVASADTSAVEPSSVPPLQFRSFQIVDGLGNERLLINQ